MRAFHRKSVSLADSWMWAIKSPNQTSCLERTWDKNPAAHWRSLGMAAKANKDASGPQGHAPHDIVSPWRRRSLALAHIFWRFQVGAPPKPPKNLRLGPDLRLPDKSHIIVYVKHMPSIPGGARSQLPRDALDCQVRRWKWWPHAFYLQCQSRNKLIFV